MKEKLPVVFRVNPNCPNHEAFSNQISDVEFMKKIIPFDLFEEEEKNEYN